MYKCGYCNQNIGTLEEISLQSHDCFQMYNELCIENDMIFGNSAKETSEGNQNTNVNLLFPINHETNMKWSDNAINLLIVTYKNNISKFDSPMYNNNGVWKYISNEMKTHGIQISGEKCNEKWRNLKKTYDKVSKHNSQTGNSKKSWPNFDVCCFLLSTQYYFTGYFIFRHYIEFISKILK